MTNMKKLMSAFRTQPPQALGGMKLARVRDYLNSLITVIGCQAEPLDGPVGDLVIMDLAEPGNYVAVRPSGTEPKVKFYIFTRLGVDESTDLTAARQRLAVRVDELVADVQAFASSF